MKTRSRREQRNPKNVGMQPAVRKWLTSRLHAHTHARVKNGEKTTVARLADRNETKEKERVKDKTCPIH
ncbi:hypothetical protein NDU88_003609 [Pleurodeles waltl]|uniref:Uncharacterized protein n=1 Tax=Pleurodeles waltl TaxID=8319 RepID=A0AAV7LFV5_PLEWA|nr:hypothetical protein NDU88_003609 [Pleurodeles waltl]